MDQNVDRANRLFNGCIRRYRHYSITQHRGMLYPSTYYVPLQKEVKTNVPPRALADETFTRLLME